MTRPAIICFAGDDWDGNPHSRHHIMRRLAGRWDVLFVEGLAMRTLAVGGGGEARRVMRKLRARAGLRTVADGLHVLRPLPIPPAGRVGRAVQLAALRRQLLVARRGAGIVGPALSWFSQPMAAPLRGRIGDRASVLYYQDRYDAFSHVDGPLLRRLVAELARGCDLAVASSEDLAGELRDLGAEPVLVRHGVELERFAESPPPPEDLAGLERPLVGFVGLLDDYLDFDCLIAAADALEHGTLVLVGGANVDVTALERHPRIQILGRRPYDAIPSYLGAFDCCLSPFAITRLTVGVNPIKLREYLAAGRPVVSTPLPEILPYRDVVSVADGPAAFADAVRAIVRPGADPPAARVARRARVAGESWDAVAARIDELLRPLLV